MLVEIGSWLQVPHTVRVLLGGESDFRIQKDLLRKPRPEPPCRPMGAPRLAGKEHGGSSGTKCRLLPGRCVHIKCGGTNNGDRLH